jgi:dienelactone hydrolase
VILEGDLSVPDRAAGVVLFAHGTGSSRHSPRNRFVAESLRKRGLGTLLVDLLTLQEEAIDLRNRQLRFDIDLLAGRLAAATSWLQSHEETHELGIGYFGASTGAAAALAAAAGHSGIVEAVVSRGGRPDLAGPALERVRAPTLLIVGGADVPVIELNRDAYSQLHVPKSFEIVPGATHLFEEPGALEAVASLAGDWFVQYLRRTSRRNW